MTRPVVEVVHTSARIRTAIVAANGTRFASWLMRALDEMVGSPRDMFIALTYHRIDTSGGRPWLYPRLLSATPEGFEAQMKLVRRYYQPVSMQQLLDAQMGVRLPPRAVLITFDDAYRDFAENAWPILRRLGIPATLFVATAFPGTARQFWWDEVWQSSVRSSPTKQVQPRPRPEPLTLAASVISHYKSLPHEELLAEAARLRETLGPSDRTVPDTLTWGELRVLEREGLFLAVHTRTHPLLTRLSAPAVRSELEGSRTDLLKGVPRATRGSTVLAYPAGAYSDRVTEVVDAAGFELAFTTERGANLLGRTNRLRLRRINVGGRADARLIRTELVLAALQARLMSR